MASLRRDVLLFFPKEDAPASTSMKALFSVQAVQIAQINRDIYNDAVTLKGTELQRITTPGDDFRPEMVPLSGTDFQSAWTSIKTGIDNGVLTYNHWFVAWQATVNAFRLMVQNSSFDNKLTLLVLIRFCMELPGFTSWIGIQTLRDLNGPSLDPTLEIYSNVKREWNDPNGKLWAKDVAETPKNPQPRLPIHLWSSERKEWIPDAHLEEHQTTPLMFMNENSPMQGTLLYHFLGKGKSAASIALSRMYPRRNVMVMVPASLRNNYEKEIASFGGNEYRKENEWVFIPVSFKDSSGRAMKLWLPSSEFQFRLPLLPFDTDMGESFAGFWLPRTYPNIVPNSNFSRDTLGKSYDVIETAISLMTKKRFHLIHYNAGEHTYRQLIKYGLEPYARTSLLRYLTTVLYKDMDMNVNTEIHKLNPEREKCWNKFNARSLVNTIINHSFTHPEWNPFNNSLVIVDESHNFISQMMTKLGNLMYLLRMHSMDTRAVLLSGTPIMNHPIEFLYMFDFIKGPQLNYILSTTNNPSEQWMFGTTHRLLRMGSQTNIEVRHPYMGWKKKTKDGELFVREPKSNIDEMKKYFGSGGVPLNRGILQSISRYGIVFKNVINKATRATTWIVDQDATFATFQRNILNRQKNGFRTESDLVKRMVEAVISYQGKTNDISSEFPESTTFEVPCEMRPYQSLLYLQTRIFESEKESVSGKGAASEDRIVNLDARDRRIGDAAMNMITEQDDDERERKSKSTGSGMYRIFSRQVCNMTFNKNDKYIVYDKSTAEGSNPVEKLLSTDCWLPDHPLRGDSKQSLTDLSIKYAQALSNIRRSPGLALLYTFFRVREGIESFERILQEYGGRRVQKVGKIEPRRKPQMDEQTEIEVTITHPLDGTPVRTTVCVGDLLLRTNLRTNENILVTFMGRSDGKEDPINNETMVKVKINKEGTQIESREGQWKDFGLIPFQYGVVSGGDKEDRGALVQLMRTERNKKGVDCAILMITKAGAEGLDLKGIRQVHVMEPFWNKVRVLQVIGRGSRNKSHNYLEPYERKVSNYIYKAVMSASNQLIKKLLQLSRTKQKTEDQMIRDLMGMSEDAVGELENGAIQQIVKMPNTSNWTEKLQRLQSQYMSDGGLTSDEYVNKVSEVKQVLVDQALTLFMSTSIEETRKEKQFKAKPIFLTPYVVYNNPNVPLEIYLQQIRDTLSVQKSPTYREPRGQFRIPVYYTPFFVIDKATNQWKEQMMELNVEWILKENGMLIMKNESPIEEMVRRFLDKLTGKRLDADPAKHMQKLLRFASSYVRSRMSQVPIIFVSDAHKEAIMLDLVERKSLVSRKFYEGEFKRMMQGGSPLIFKPDETMNDVLSDEIREFWRAHGFKG